MFACRTPRLLALALVLLVLPPVHAGAPKRHHDITIDDYFTQADIFQSVISPDSKHVAYTEGRWQKSTDDRKTDLWVVACATGKSQRLTSERASDRAPAWSRDNKTIYFLGNRKREGDKRPQYNGKTQVWRIAVKGGQPEAVTRLADDVEMFELSPEGRFLFYVTQVEEIDKEWRKLREKFKKIEYGHGVNKLSQIWKLDLHNWRTEKLFAPGRVIREMSLSPDGNRLALITTPDDKVVSFEGQSRVDVYDLKSGKLTTPPTKAYRADMPSPYGWLEKLAWAGDGKALAFTVIFDAYPAEIMAVRWTDDKAVVFKMPRPPGVHVRGYGTPLQWHGDDLFFLGEATARVRLYSASGVLPGEEPKFHPLTPAEAVVESFSLADKGEAAVLMNDTTHLQDIFLVKSSGQPKRLTNVNPQTETWKLPQISIVSWKGAKGDNVEGVLELPPDYKPGQKLPLVVEIHGGPTTSTLCKLQYWIYGRTLLPAKGYALLSPNYRGSTGYGDKFLTDLIGRENDIEVEDILKGVDALVARGLADPDRLAVLGWSNGGYLTNCVIAKTTRFKAAISGAGIVDAVMEFGANDEPAYAIVFKKGFPWSNPARYHKASPTYELNKIRTPTLIHVGGNDDRCPPGHSRMLYRALKEYVRVPTELLVYPGEGHGLMKYNHRKAKMEWDLAWLERHVLGKKK
jgi:dipeptidyl aminopeptidase/acylaminoacyl peptidase